MRILVTGGTGFVGRWIVDALTKTGTEVIICSRQATGPDHIVADLLAPDAADLLLAQTRPDIVVHNAWCVDHGRFWTMPENLDWTCATLRLAKAASRTGVQRFIGVGTCFEYAWPDTGDCNEISTPVRPSSLYATTKDATRRIIEDYAENTAMAFAWARLFYLFGPHEHPERLAASIASKLASGKPAPISSGRAVRDFMDVRDAGAAIAALALSSATGAVNIGSGVGMSIHDLAKAFELISGLEKVVVGALPDRANEPPRIVADITKLQKTVGFTPSAQITQRLEETYQWWKDRSLASLA